VRYEIFSSRMREIYVQEVEVHNLKIDTDLLSTLIEFWRPETHTFYFNLRDDCDSRGK
jgi:hypothetical protein